MKPKWKRPKMEPADLFTATQELGGRVLELQEVLILEIKKGSPILARFFKWIMVNIASGTGHR